MASAVFASNNESYWGEKVNVRDYSVKRSRISNPNPSSNVQPKQIDDTSVRSTWQAKEAPPRNHPSPPRPADVTGRADYITINMAEYSKAELRELQRRLRSELDQVRSVRAQVEVMGRNRKQAIMSGPAREPNRAELDVIVKKTMTKCLQMLARLMKHEHAWVFNKPVDIVRLGLHDYLQIIESPMDLGTVKAKLGKKEYKSPFDFALDVRLTFKNAMKYNPKGQDVHIMADNLLRVFERMFNPVFEKFESERRRLVINELKSLPQPKLVQERLPDHQPKLHIPDKQQSVMSFEEKAKLGMSLQELAPDQMGPMLAILRRRNTGMAQDGDEIELDFEALDNETLWELSTFVNDLEKAKMVDVVDEDVDIGEEIPLGDYPPLEIEKDTNGGTSSGSSRSGSGTSSFGGSGSVTSSGSDSDEDSTQSPFVERK